MYIDTDNAVYDIDFSQVQIEITGICNMNCRHCRDSFDKKADMPLEEIEKILKFATKNGSEILEVVLSGGEPLLHKGFEHILWLLDKYEIKKLYITTNGSMPVQPYLPIFKKMQTMVSVSLDSIIPNEHDSFRNYTGAYDKAIETINLLRDNEIKASIRASLLPENINQIPEIAEHAYGLGVTRLAISSILPIGNALDDSSMFMTQDLKKDFLLRLFTLREKYLPLGMKITTNDPLQNICRYKEVECHEQFVDEIVVAEHCRDCYNLDVCFPKKEEGVTLIEGCTGGVTSFNVFANGDLTPCAILNMQVLNVFETPVEELEELYVSNEIVKNLVGRAFSGKCGTCALKFVCGGCRARAKNTYNDYLAEDPDCWK